LSLPAFVELQVALGLQGLIELGLANLYGREVFAPPLNVVIEPDVFHHKVGDGIPLAQLLNDLQPEIHLGPLRRGQPALQTLPVVKSGRPPPTLSVTPAPAQLPPVDEFVRDASGQLQHGGDLHLLLRSHGQPVMLTARIQTQGHGLNLFASIDQHLDIELAQSVSPSLGYPTLD
jgi:hypothetical protein